MNKILAFIILLFIGCSKKESKEIFSLRNSRNKDERLELFAVNNWPDVNVFISLDRSNKLIWGPSKIDTRDLMEDVPDAYNYVEWKDETITLGPGRERGKAVIDRVSGKLIRWEK